MIRENIKMAIRSITGNKLRSSLTMLGLIIGIASVVTINAIGEGVKKSVTAQVDELGTNLIQVTPGSGDFTDFTSSLGTSTLSELDVQTIQKISGIEAVAPSMIVSGAVSGNGRQTTGGFILATTPDYARAIKTELEFGSFLAKGATDQIVIGYEVAKKLFDNPSSSDIGKTVEIRNTQFKIVGITKKPAESGLKLGPGIDSAVYIPFEDGKQFNNGNANINEIEIKAADPTKVAEIKDQIKEKVKASHGGQVDFSVADAKEQLKVFDQILSLLTTFVAAIASIALLVGGIGIMNIMLVSVTERTREIGLRKALGATRTTILNQFLIEAMVLCLVGGTLGIVFAYAGAFGVGKFAHITPVIAPGSIGLAVGISVAVGIVFGIAPAIKAARMKPIDALRYE